MASPLRVTLLLSASIHIACFGIFEPTFGSSLSKPNLTQIAFLGPILEVFDFSPTVNYPQSMDKNISKYTPVLKSQSLIKKQESEFLSLKVLPLKPLVTTGFKKDKSTFIPKIDLASLKQRKREPTVIFYPPLPYSFLLYFQDRQTAHIEFMFYISKDDKVTSIKRKISSGNLDADILALRYIAHYLNLYEENFPADSWQTVEIDLSRENDKD